jgi:putative transposase
MLLTEEKMSDRNGVSIMRLGCLQQKTDRGGGDMTAQPFAKPWKSMKSKTAFHLGRIARVRWTGARIPYKKRHKIENMFAKLKDWRRIVCAMML